MHRIASLPSATLLVLLGFAIASAAPQKTEPQPAPAPIFPRALEPGDTIVFIAPAKYLDQPRCYLAKKRLERLGFNVVFPKTLFRRHGYLAGTDDERAAEINAAFADPKVAAIFPGTGGFGTTRIVGEIDYDLIRRNPKIFVGFSDITGLHIAINQQTGLVTFHSPNPEYGLGNPENMQPWPAHWFWRAIRADKYPATLGGDHRAGGLVGSALSGYSILAMPTKRERRAAAKLYDDVPTAETLNPGTARGRLIGGNLSVLHAMMGTPYEIQTDDKILFLEDVGEDPYRIDRMLSTLKLAGKFDDVNGVVLGCFTRRRGEQKWSDDWSMDDVLKDYFADLGVPVLKDFPVGHVMYNTTLPIGAEVELDATKGTLTILENPVVLPSSTDRKE